MISMHFIISLFNKSVYFPTLNWLRLKLVENEDGRDCDTAGLRFEEVDGLVFPLPIPPLTTDC